MDKYLALLKRLQTEETYDALTKLYSEVLAQWGKDSPKRETEFETIYQLGFIEGKKEGLKEFFNKIENYGG